ncbi:MAG: sensor histidine kinase [Bacillota bacterium]|nr:sensor histidine kinase [Bacillota bacterium]MDD3298369.1 sensor histidine kinase [Bacillota bacterium]MDD3851219.1 sensor histidine kinase [Bacillota bacterium]MDD4707554.1 sensor histidine kinase [Bacillota bacterium]
MSEQMEQMKKIDEIIHKTIKIMEAGQRDVFDIAEHAHNGSEEIQKELKELRDKVLNIIQEVESLRKAENSARYKLLVVSKDFRTHTEEDIKKAYRKAEELKVELSLKEQEEIRLREERNRLELKLKDQKKLVKKAENVVTHMGAVLDYLRAGALGISGLAEDVRKKQYLGYRIIKATEEERSRIVREIHDVPVQAMVNMGIRLELCMQVLNKDIDKARSYIRELKEQVNTNIQDLRKIIYNLRPMSLDDLGLVATIEKLLSDFESDSGISTSFRLIGEPVEIKELIQIAVFRIIQEALNNAKRHSKAKKVSVKFEFLESSISILITDDGVGFEIEGVIDWEEDDRCFGLIGMRERVELLQGYMDINSAPGKGTGIFMRIPFE